MTSNCSPASPLVSVSSSSSYCAEMLDALEQAGNEVALKSAVSHLSPSEIDHSFTHSADGVFSTASIDLPPQLREDLTQQDTVTIYPVHYAVMMGWKGCLEILLDAGANPNVKDSLGQTPLHILPKGSWKFNEESFQGCLDILLAHQDIDFNRLDLSMSTPLFRAKQLNYTYMVDRLKDVSLANNPSLKNTTLSDTLLKEILDMNLEGFQAALESIENSGAEKRIVLDENHGSYTLLQLACRCGLLKFAEELLSKMASPVKRYDSNIFSPVLWVTKYGYHRILHRLINSMTEEDLRSGALIDCNDMGEGPLHLSVMCSNHRNSDEVDYYHCLELLLDKKEYFDIDLTNCDGNTAIHFAALCEDLRAFSKLLTQGADSTVVNSIGACSLHYMTKESILQTFDNCIEFDDKKKMVDKDFWIKLNYKMMTTNIGNENNDTKEMKFLSSLSKTFQDKDVLEHPLINIFVYLKWQKIKKFFFLNFTFHILFGVLLLTYISIYHSSLEGPIPIVDRSYIGILRFCLILLIFISLLLREFVQIFMVKSSRHYISKAKNITEIITSFLTVLLILSQFDLHVKMAIASWLVVFCLLEFLLHMGQLPPFALYITMFRTVAWNFFKFICLFSLIIVAFGFSFYLMFQASDTFKTFPESLLKTIIMTTGEVDYNDLPISSFPVAAHLLMALFVFLILLVIVNLLNGLAISDIQAIQHRSEVISRISLVDRMTQLEKAFFVDSDQTPFKKLFNRFFGTTLLMKSCIPEASLVVYVGQKKFSYKTTDKIDSSICDCHGFTLSQNHIQTLKRIVMERKRASLRK